MSSDWQREHTGAAGRMGGFLSHPGDYVYHTAPRLLQRVMMPGVVQREAYLTFENKGGRGFRGGAVVT